MAITIGTAPQYSGSISTAQPAPQTFASGGSFQGSSYNPNQTVDSSVFQGSTGGGVMLGASTINAPGAYTGPSAAAIAETNRVNNVRDAAGIRRGGLETGAQTSLTDNQNTYGNDSTGFVGGIRQGQGTINTGRANNALNLRRSMAAIASGVRTGLRSGSVDLANMNALDSGAADAMARAWARQGNLQSGSANNEAQLKGNELASQQTNLDLQETQGLGKLQQWRSTETNRVSNKLYNDLQVLEADSVAQGAGGVVDMGVRDRLISAASAELDALDRATNAALGEINAWNEGQVNAEAMRMESLGQGVANPFAVESIGSGKSGGVPGAPIGQYDTRPRFRDEEAAPTFNPFSRDELQPGIA